MIYDTTTHVWTLRRRELDCLLAFAGKDGQHAPHYCSVGLCHDTGQVAVTNGHVALRVIPHLTARAPDYVPFSSGQFRQVRGDVAIAYDPVGGVATVAGKNEVHIGAGTHIGPDDGKFPCVDRVIPSKSPLMPITSIGIDTRYLSALKKLGSVMGASKYAAPIRLEFRGELDPIVAKCHDTDDATWDIAIMPVRM